jgi:heptosyltransferase-2
MKIAVFWPNWVGDAVMATPAVRALRARFPAAHFIGLLKPYVSGALEGSPWLDQQILLDSRIKGAQGWISASATLRGESVDLAILFPNSLRTAIIAWLGKCRRRVGYARYGRSWLLTDALQPLRGQRGELVPSPIIHAYNRLVEHVGCSVSSLRMELFTTPADEIAADRVWETASFYKHPEVVCLNPGAAFGSAKFWPAEHFVRLGQTLIDRRRSGILVLCGPNERDVAHQIVGAINRPGVCTVGDFQPSLGLTKACVRRCNLLISTDSGPRHFAAAFDRPVITLFGPTHIAWTETYHAKAIHLQKKVECGPCQRRICPLDHRCMTLLKPEEVFEHATELLQRYTTAESRYRLRDAV